VHEVLLLQDLGGVLFMFDLSVNRSMVTERHGMHFFWGTLTERHGMHFPTSWCQCGVLWVVEMASLV
jgi:hypothetical protein